MKAARIILCLMVTLFMSCNSVVLFKRTRPTPKLLEAQVLLLSMEDAGNVFGDVREAADNSLKKEQPWRQEIVVTNAARHRANLRKLYTLIETKRQILDYPRLLTYIRGHVAWQSWNHRYRFRMGVQDDGIAEGKVTSEFEIYTDQNGVIIEKKPVDYLW